MKQSSLRSVYTSLFAALICAGSFFSIPIGPIHIVIQNALAILAGLLLGPVQGAGAVGLFLLAGILGLPVFSGGQSGIAVLFGTYRRLSCRLFYRRICRRPGNAPG